MSMKNDNEKDLDILSSSIKDENSKEVKKSEKALAKAEKKRAKAKAKREKYDAQISELKAQIANESDESKKANLVAKRDALIKQRDSVSSNGVSKSTAKTIKIVVAVVLVVAILATYIATGAVRNGLLAQFSIPQKTLTAATIVDKEGTSHKIKVSTYNFYFANMYNNLRQQYQMISQYKLDPKQYGLDVDFNEKFDKQSYTKEDGTVITWAEHMEEEVLNTIKTTYLYYYEAVAENGGQEPEITAEQQKQIDDNIAQYQEAAHKNGFEINAFIKATMGKGVNVEVMKRELKVSFISDNYKQDYMKSLAEQSYTDDQIESYKADHYNDLATIDARIFECTNEDDAKAFASELKKDGSNFNALASKYSTDEFTKKAISEDANWTLSVAANKDILKQNQYAIATAAEHSHAEGEEHDDNEPGLYPGLDWLFSADRKAGEIKQYSTTVVYLMRPAGISDIKPVNVRHILVSPVDSEDPQFDQTTASEEQWQAAYDKAKEIVNTFNSGDKTPEAFGELAKTESKDPGSAQKGGLYENVLPGQMVPSFNGWCFDSARKAGDVAIVKSEFGYHVMYFEGAGEEPSWKTTIKNQLAQTDSQDKFKVKEEEYSIKTNAFGELFLQRDVDFNA